MWRLPPPFQGDPTRPRSATAVVRKTSTTTSSATARAVLELFQLFRCQQRLNFLAGFLVNGADLSLLCL